MKLKVSFINCFIVEAKTPSEAIDKGLEKFMVREVLGTPCYDEVQVEKAKYLDIHNDEIEKGVIL